MLDGGAYVDQALIGYQSAQRPQVSATGGKINPDRTKAVAEDFEAFFVSRMIESMFAGIETNGLFGGGHGEQVFRSVMIQEYGKEVVRSGGFGIADAVQKHLLSLQEARGQ